MTGSYLEEPTTVLLGTTVLTEELEGSLLGLVALAGEVLEGLLAGGHLLAADNAVVLVLDKVLLSKTSGGVLGSSVINLSLGSNSHFKFGHLILLTAIFVGGCPGKRKSAEKLRMNNSNSEKGLITPNAPRKVNPTMRRRPNSWSNNTTSDNSNSTVAVPVAPVPLRGQKRGYNGNASGTAKRVRPGGLVELAHQMVQQIPQQPVRVSPPVRMTNDDDEDDLTNENVVNAVTLTNNILQNTTSYFDELISLLRSYYPGYGKIHRERNGSQFMLPDVRSQEKRDEDARRDFRSLLGYIDRIEQDYVIPDSVADFVKSIRSYKYYPDEVNEKLMNKISQQIFPALEDFKIRLGRKSIQSLGPSRGGKRSRRRTVKKLNRRRHRRTQYRHK